MHYLIEGDTNKCIARKMDITEATVKVHVKAILRKIRVQNRTQAAIWAMNNGSLTRSADKNFLPNPGGVIAEAPAQLRVSSTKQIRSRQFASTAT